MYEFDYENKLRYQTEPKCIYVQVNECGVCTKDISLANEITRLLMPTSQSLLTCNLFKHSNTKIPNIVLIIGLWQTQTVVHRELTKKALFATDIHVPPKWL